ncbi:MAG: YajQ family cyclic di-GMP-binding protein [Bacteroidia bacterium]
MPSFDIVSKVDLQSLDNAINTVRKEILTRWDFRDSKTEIDLDKKAMNIHVVTEDEMKINQIGDIIISRCMKQGISGESLDFGKEQYASGNMVKKDIKIKQGIDKETSKKITKSIKETGLKVQASIMEDQVRVTGKKIDDLQAVMAHCRAGEFGIPLQFDNMKS